MTTRSPAHFSQKHKHAEAFVTESHALLHDSHRPAKVRRLDPAMSSRGSAAKSSSQSPGWAPPKHFTSGSRSDPIVIYEDNADDLEQHNVQGSDVRPLFLQLGDCLDLALDMLPPDVSRQYVFEKCLLHQEVASDAAVCATFVFESFSSEGPDYRKEASDSAAKHIPSDLPAGAHVWKDTWEKYKEPLLYHFFACHSLAAEFPLFERAYIEFLFVLKGSLYLTYLTLHQQSQRQLNTAKSWTAPKRSLAFLGCIRGSPTADPGHAHVQRELAAAVQSCQQTSLVSVPQRPVSTRQRQIWARAPVECLCCFTESPLDQMVSCGGQQPHQFCRDCMNRYIDTLLGDMKCRPTCFASGPECQAPITSQELRRCLPPATLDLLLDRQVHEDLKDLEITVADCPFCDYAEELTPALPARWFVCKNQKCAKTSCMSCRELAHMPMSCAEARASKKKTDDILTQRHVLEEAMTAALMRKCNKCKVPFVKIDGCNSMTCPRAGCHNKQCYVCGSNVKDYGHFGGKCTLHDTFTVEDRHRQEVHSAQETTIVKIRQRNPSFSADDLKGKQPLLSASAHLKRTQRSKIEQSLGQRVKEPEPPRHQLAVRRKGTFRLDEAVHPNRTPLPAPPPLYPHPSPPISDNHSHRLGTARLQAQLPQGSVPKLTDRPLAPALHPAEPAGLGASNEWNAKSLSAIRDRLDGISRPCAAVVHQEHESHPDSQWGRDLLQQLNYAGRTELDGRSGTSDQANEQNRLAVLLYGDPDPVGSGSQSALGRTTGFATLAARTAMRPGVANGQSHR